jgi:hypothetical protein
LEYSLPCNILFGIFSTCPNQLILCDLINLTISSPFSTVFISSLYLILHILYFPSLVRKFCVLFFSHIESLTPSVVFNVYTPLAA